MNEYMPESITSPCETLRDAMENKMMTTEDLARGLEVSEEVAHGLVAGTKLFTDEICTKLGTVFNCSTKFWINRKNSYYETYPEFEPVE